MKITCDREKLQHAFAAVAAVAPTRSPKPILQNVKLELGEDRATLTGTDLEVGIRLDVQGAPDQVDGLVQAVARTLANNITKQDVDDSPPDDQLGDPAGPDAFGIRY